jgi:hypothetical protein
MPREIWNAEWPNVNAQRKYPFSQDATLTVGDFVLSNDLIVDFVLPVNVTAAPDPTLFHLKQLGVFSSGIILSFAYNDAVFATVNVPVTGFVPYSTYVVQGAGALSDAQGWLTIGQIDGTLRAPGAYTFTVSAGRLLPSVIRPRLRTVASLSVVNGADVGPALTGDIALVAGRNFRFRVDLSGLKPTIILDAISGEGTVTPCTCSTLDEAAPCIRTINGQYPSDNGDFIIQAGECVQLVTGTAQIAINDTCTKPCCDCRELEVVTTAVSQVQQQVQTMSMVAQRLDQELANTQGNILASKTTGLPPQ